MRTQLTRFEPRRARAVGRGALRSALGSALVSALLPLAAVTQSPSQRSTPVNAVNYLIAEDGSRVPIQAPRGFKLFAEEDLAANGMKMTGTFGWGFPNVGPCPFYALTIPRMFCGLTVNAAGNTIGPYFEVALVAGAPLSDFRKIRAAHPPAANMLGPVGYTSPWTSYLVAPNARRWGPLDGQFGNFFSGVTATNDGSCRDNTSNLNGQVPTGFTLLAGSDCPQTWGSKGFQGKRPIPDSTLAALFKANPSGFRFDDWRYPKSALDTTQFLGSYTMYGGISDSYRELIQRYGNVTKLGDQRQTPQERGYPLGLDIRFDAWQFSRPSIRNAAFWQITIVNNSARLYGRGIDYDSLYMGLVVGYLFNNQTVSWYHDFNRDAIIAVGGNTSGRCSATFPRRITGVLTTGCPIADANNPGFRQTGQGIMVLKSPIGDLKNKLFSRPGPFFNPTSPLADDTITFNHASRSAFGLHQTFAGRSDRSFFGHLSNTEENFLDGRTLGDFTALQIWQFFQNENFNGTVTPSVARYNRFVPGATAGYGTWDYNNDGVQDTISVPTCGRNGCVALYADTSAAGLENRAGNIHNLVSAGPFKLKAGDTTQFIYAFYGAADPLAFENLTNAIANAYLTNFAGANPVPPPQFTAADVEVTPAQVRDSLLGVQTALVRIRIRNPTPRNDPFIQDVLNKLQTSTDTPYTRLRNLNPTLISQVQARVRNNFSQLLVFKSCDKGQTFTTTTGGGASCAPSRAQDVTGADIAFGWQPIAVIPVNPVTGQLLSNVFTDVVQAGRTYLYSFVTRTRGLSDIPVVDTVCAVGTGGTGQPACQRVVGPTTLGRALRVDADTINSALQRSGPSTVLVYAPITLPAGTNLATLDTATVAGTSTQRVTAVALSSIQPGTYRVLFANRFIVTTQRDTVKGTSTQTVIAQHVLFGASQPGGARQAQLVARADTFPNSPGELFAQGATVPSRRTGASGSVVTFVDTVTAANFTAGGLGYLIAGGTKAAPTLFFLSANLSNPPPSFEAAVNFPGFATALEALPGTSTPRPIPTTQGTATVGVTIRPPNDTIIPQVVENNGVTYQPGRSTRLGPGGSYEIEWAGDAFGPDAPFRLGTVAEMQPVLDRSLSARPVASTGDSSAGVRDTIRSALTAERSAASAAGNTALANAINAILNSNRPLLPVKMPFVLRGQNGQPATVAMFRRNTAAADSVLANSILVGTIGDTTRLSVPRDVWMPGDTLYVLETVMRDSTVTSGGVTTTIVDPSTGRPFQVQARVVTFTRFVLGCASVSALIPGRITCNPIALGTRGATGYLPYAAGWKTRLEFVRPFELFTEVQLSARATAVAARPARAAGEKVIVVPNPYIVQSQFDEVNAARQGEPRILFTNVPDQGVLRVYSVSGQFLQQVTWTVADLINRGTGLSGPGAQVNGDLPYNLRTREGLELGSGLYMYVLTGSGSNAKGFRARGKFVIIR